MENKLQHTCATPREFSLQLLEHITNCFSKEHIVGRGGYGVVYKGVLDNGEEVAVKKLYYQPGLDDEQFKNELTNLMRVQHQNIIRLVGYCYEIRHQLFEHNGGHVFAGVEERAICFEYLQCGSLDEHLSDESCRLDWHTCYKIMKGVCEGLNYLHNGSKDPIYHLDLKPANILLDKNMVPKIGDFGLSRLFASTQTCTAEHIIGTRGYMPPEYINRSHITQKFDVFSLGVIIIQVMAGREGYFKCADMPSQEFAELVLVNWGKRLQSAMSSQTSLEVKTCIRIALRCVEDDRVKRPTITEIVDELNMIDTAKMSLDEDASSGSKQAFNQNLSSAAERKKVESEPTVVMEDAMDEVVSQSLSVQVDGSGIKTGRLYKQHAAGAEDVGRRMWVRDRSNSWWEQCSSADYPEADFRCAFRMSRATFDMVCDALSPVITKEDTVIRAAIPVRQRVAVCVWRLATGEPLRLISRRFGVGISTCHNLILEICAGISSLLMPRFLQWPGNAKATAFKASFEAISGIPDIVGAMYTTHIPILAPKVFVNAHLNRCHTERNQRPSYSVTLQGVVGLDGTFIDVCIGWPGALRDDQVLDKSTLQQRAFAGTMAGTWVVGGTSYPLMDWLLVPYTHQNLTPAQQVLNKKVVELERVAVHAFTRLKGRWAFLQKRIEMKPSDLPTLLSACCVLHNICEITGEEMHPELRYDLFDDLTVPENPVSVWSYNGSQARDLIAHNLLHHGLAGSAFLP